MAELTWDGTGEKVYETGTDHGVLYIPDSSGVYNQAYAWNGLTAVTEAPTGAEPNAQYADNIKYLNLLSTEEFGFTIEAFTYPDAFGQCDGTASPADGVVVGQQTRKTFGFSYRTLIGNDVDGTDYGYKLHLVYGALAAPSEKAYQTVNDSPEAITFSWEVTTTPVAVSGLKPTALITINSTEADSTALTALEDILYGTALVDGRLPLPDEVVALFSSTPTAANSVAPTYNDVTDVITIPSVTGLKYFMDGVEVPSGPTDPITGNVVITAAAEPGYYLVGDDDWYIEFV